MHCKRIRREGTVMEPDGVRYSLFGHGGPCVRNSRGKKHILSLELQWCLSPSLYANDEHGKVKVRVQGLGFLSYCTSSCGGRADKGRRVMHQCITRPPHFFLQRLRRFGGKIWESSSWGCLWYLASLGRNKRGKRVNVGEMLAWRVEYELSSCCLPLMN